MQPPADRPVPPPVVASDLDGTLVRPDGSISPRSRAALARVEATGSTLVLVTGRPPRWMDSIPAETGHRGLAVCANGALVYDLHTGQVVEEHLLEPDVAMRVALALRRDMPGTVFAVERGLDFGREPTYRTRWPSGPGVAVAELDELLAAPVAKLLARHPELGPDEMLLRGRGVAGDWATFTHSSVEGLLEISAAGVSKASTLALLCAERGVGAAGVVAFGDMPNDIPMLAWAGLGVAVANAHPEVLAVADEVTASVQDDGVALVLERLFPAVGLQGPVPAA